MMIKLEQWSYRPPEEANLFNPPFIAVLACEFIKSYSKPDQEGASLFILIVALALSLHAQTRGRFPYSTVTPLYAWIQDNEDLLVGLADRAGNIRPFVQEAVMFGIKSEIMHVDKYGKFASGTKKMGFAKSFIDSTTPETKHIIEQTKFVGRWFAKSGSEISVAAALGVKL